jgi:hypothetical protein
VLQLHAAALNSMMLRSKKRTFLLGVHHGVAFYVQPNIMCCWRSMLLSLTNSPAPHVAGNPCCRVPFTQPATCAAAYPCCCRCHAAFAMLPLPCCLCHTAFALRLPFRHSLAPCHARDAVNSFGHHLMTTFHISLPTSYDGLRSRFMLGLDVRQLCGFPVQ